MQSNNPVLAKTDWGQSQQPVQGYPQDPNAQQFYGQQYPQDPNAQQFYAQAPANVMTIDDVITKSAITLGTVVLVAAVTMWAFETGLLPMALLQPVVIVGALVAFGVVLMDPPYDVEPDGDLAALAEGDWLEDGALVVLERSVRSADPVFPEAFAEVSSRRYGETVVWYATFEQQGRRLGA